MAWRWLIVWTSVLAAGCQESPVATSVQEITFSATGCYGSCPAFTFKVRDTGAGEYEGGAYVAVRGRREFTATPQQFQALAKRLAPFRPRGEVTYDTSCDGPWSTDS